MNINLYTIDNKMIDFSLVPSPCYVMDEFLLRKNLELMHSIQERAGVKIILALKGFALWGAFRKIKEYLPGATASSLHEAMLCWEEMGVKPHTYCVAYREEDFDTIASLSSHITFNSISQYNTFKNRLKTLSSKVSCGLRINPECSDVKYDIYNPSSPQSRLGITIETFPDTIPDGIEGLHFHTLCESNSYSLERVMESVEKKFSCFLKNIRWINMGGGHLMTDSNYHVEHLIDILQKFRNKWGIEIILEPGGAVAWETGFLVVKILDIVENGGVKTAILDTSFSCHMSDFLDMGNKPKIKNAFTEPIPHGIPYRMGGVTCLAGDFMGDYYFQKPLQIGENIIFEDMIHYTMVKTTTFNGIKHPSIAIWRENNTLDIIKQFGYEDYKNRLS